MFLQINLPQTQKGLLLINHVAGFRFSKYQYEIETFSLLNKANW
jgi:hypothetical protein